jgi:hypothetical protein
MNLITLSTSLPHYVPSFPSRINNQAVPRQALHSLLFALTSTVVVAELKHALAGGEKVALLLVGGAGLVAKARGVAEEVVGKVGSVGLAEALGCEWDVCGGWVV